MPSKLIPIFLLCVLAGCNSAHADKVIGITDGDTFTLLRDKTTIKVRLAEIDCPERKQPFGSRAKQALSDKIFGKEVKLEGEKKDRYGRTIATVVLDDRNINLEMVKDGFAWQYKQYSKSKEFEEAEKEARDNKIGLWVDADPVPPWEFRKK